MTGLGPRLVVAAYAIALLGGLLWQGLRGMSRVRAVIDYLDLRERSHPDSHDWPVPPLAKQAALPPGTLAVLAAGFTLVPLVIGVAIGRTVPWQMILAGIGVAGALLVVLWIRRSPWAETRVLLWKAAATDGDRRGEILEEALEADPQVNGRAARER